jgi:hypothetical protein
MLVVSESEAAAIRTAFNQVATRWPPLNCAGRGVRDTASKHGE